MKYRGVIDGLLSTVRVGAINLESDTEFEDGAQLQRYEH